MSKPALGRSLSDLMSGQKVPSNLPTATNPGTTDETPTETTAAPAEAPVETTPGVDTLLRGKTETSKAIETTNPFANAPTEPKPPVNWSLLKTVLIVADVLLIVPTSFFVLTKSGRMSFFEGTLCVITFAFAAALGCLAYFIHQHGRK